MKLKHNLLHNDCFKMLILARTYWKKDLWIVATIQIDTTLCGKHFDTITQKSQNILILAGPSKPMS